MVSRYVEKVALHQEIITERYKVYRKEETKYKQKIIDYYIELDKEVRSLVIEACAAIDEIKVIDNNTKKGSRLPIELDGETYRMKNEALEAILFNEITSTQQVINWMSRKYTWNQDIEDIMYGMSGYIEKNEDEYHYGTKYIKLSVTQYDCAGKPFVSIGISGKKKLADGAELYSDPNGNRAWLCQPVEKPQPVQKPVEKNTNNLKQKVVRHVSAIKDRYKIDKSVNMNLNQTDAVIRFYVETDEAWRNLLIAVIAIVETIKSDNSTQLDSINNTRREITKSILLGEITNKRQIVEMFSQSYVWRSDVAEKQEADIKASPYFYPYGVKYIEIILGKDEYMLIDSSNLTFNDYLQVTAHTEATRLSLKSLNQLAQENGNVKPSSYVHIQNENNTKENDTFIDKQPQSTLDSSASQDNKQNSLSYQDTQDSKLQKQYEKEYVGQKAKEPRRKTAEEYQLEKKQKENLLRNGLSIGIGLTGLLLMVASGAGLLIGMPMVVGVIYYNLVHHKVIEPIDFKKVARQVIKQIIKLSKKTIQVGMKLTKQVIKLAKKIIKLFRKQVIALCANVIKHLEDSK